MPGWTQILLVAVLVLFFFGGRGRISSFMGDMAKGITAFRTGLKEGETDTATDKPAASLTADDTATPAAPVADPARDPAPRDPR